MGLAYGRDGVVNANRGNNHGCGSGSRRGYCGDDWNCVELARTEAQETQITMIKTQNTWVNGSSYSNSDNGGSAIGCYHVLLERGFSSYQQAASAASSYSDGFVAWIEGEYQVRAGAYTSESAAQAASEPGRNHCGHQLLCRQCHPHRKHPDSLPI